VKGSAPEESRVEAGSNQEETGVAFVRLLRAWYASC
jgi:hypothetical protein